MPIRFDAIPAEQLPTNWEIEDLIYPGHTTIGIHHSSGFSASLLNVLGIYSNSKETMLTNANNSFHVAQLTLSESNWNRDTIVKTFSGHSFYLNDVDDFTNYEIQNIFSGKADRRYQNLISFYRAGVPKAIGANHFLQLTTAQENSVSFHTLPLAGGNIITARRAFIHPENNTIRYEHDPIFIVGRSALLLTANSMHTDDIRQTSLINRDLYDRKMIEHFVFTYFTPLDEKHGTETSSLKTNRIFYAQQYLTAKTLIRAFLTQGKNLDSELTKKGPLRRSVAETLLPRTAPRSFKRVVFVNQWAYHIDLQMLYIGFGVVLIHDFTYTVYFLEQMKKKHPSRMINFFLTEARELEAQFQSSVLITINQLKKQGLYPVRVPGLLIPNRNLQDGSIQSAESFDEVNAASINFMNSLAIVPRHTQNEILFTLLVPSSTKERILFQEMANTIQDCVSASLEPIFKRKVYLRFSIVAYNSKDFKSAELFMISKSGGLRCQTTLGPRHFFESIKNVFKKPGDYNTSVQPPDSVSWFRTDPRLPKNTFIFDLQITQLLIGTIQLTAQGWSQLQLPHKTAAAASESTAAVSTIAPAQTKDIVSPPGPANPSARHARSAKKMPETASIYPPRDAFDFISDILKDSDE